MNYQKYKETINVNEKYEFEDEEVSIRFNGSIAEDKPKKSSVEKPIEKKEVVIEPTVVENIIEPDKVEPQVVFVEKKTKAKKGGEKNNKENDGENGRE